MKEYNIPFQYHISENYLPEKFFKRYYEEYPVQYIKDYCMNPEVPEHESALEGTFSAPLDSWPETPELAYDQEIVEYIRDNVLSEVMTASLGKVYSYDHHYVNCHYDLPGSSLGIHNDLKDFRWLITNQIYMDSSDQGVRLLNRDASGNKRLNCEPNMFYSLQATPFSWHDVPELHTEKRSVLFRVGKRKHKTVAQPDSNNDTAYVIYNNFHNDQHYAKLGLRMGNLTEAWIDNLGGKNIYHSRWRCEDTLKKVCRYAAKHHKRVIVVLSGYMPSSLDALSDSTVCKEYTGSSLDFKKNTDAQEYHRITEENKLQVADAVFGKPEAYPEIANAEEILFKYTEEKRYMNFKEINLNRL